MKLCVLLLTIFFYGAVYGAYGCGKPDVQPHMDNTEIVGGRDAKPHSWPWMIALYLGKRHLCGGSVLNENWILTAAHCVNGRVNSKRWSVKAGKHFLIKSESSEQHVKVSKVVMHESYDDDTIDYDVALLKLQSPLTLNSKVSSVCLAQGGVSHDEKCFTTGWGDTQGTAFPDRLKQAKVPIVENSVCNKRSYYNGEITSRMLCAGYQGGGHDACQGDSGGPLVCLVNGKWEQHGVTSWGEGCARANKPGVYARVKVFNQWIESKMNSN